MIRHLGPADYRTVPWANGLGQTVELARSDGPGGPIWRLSRASVVADGPFSVLPGIARNLTVISGPGFDLRGAGQHLRASPLVPIAFSGGESLTAIAVSAPSEDFNVMVPDSLPPPEVKVQGPGWIAPPSGGLVAAYFLADGQVNGDGQSAGDLVLSDEGLQITAGHVLSVLLFPGSEPLRLPLPRRSLQSNND